MKTLSDSRKELLCWIIYIIIISLIVLLSSCEHKYIEELQEEEIITIDEIDTVSVVQIGDQIWMKYNLNVIKLNDGSDISLVTDNSLWSNSSPSCCYYNNDEKYSKYGLLYNYYTVESNKICPDGFKVPSDNDWKQLETYLGIDLSSLNKWLHRGTIEGGMLKEKSLNYWYEPNSHATDEYGFSALPGGMRYYNGQFEADNPSYKQVGVYWSSSLDNQTGLPIYRSLSPTLGSILRYRHSKNMGFSIRCIKNL